MNARAQTSAPILPRSAEEGHAGYGAASSTPFDGFSDTGFGIPTTRDARETPDAGRRAAGRGVLGALTRTLTSSPVVKSAGVLSIFALGAAVGTLSARDADLGSVVKVRVPDSVHARLPRGRLPAIPRLFRAATRVASRVIAGETRSRSERGASLAAFSEKTFFSFGKCSCISARFHPRASLTSHFPLSPHTQDCSPRRDALARACLRRAHLRLG